MVTAIGEKRPSFREWAGFMAMVAGMFMAILDIQIVNSSLSEIQAGLSASPDEVSWIQTSYLIAEVIMIPLSGILARLLSTRVLFSLSAVGFTASSLLCAFAWNIESMVVFRALQGFLGGAMIPTAFAATFILFPLSMRPTVSVAIGLVVTVAPTLGPTLGGLLTQNFSWHWLFLINVVPGPLVALAAWSLVDIDKPNWSILRGFDLLGMTTMALFLGGLEFVMEEGPRNDWFEHTPVTITALVTVLSGTIFFFRVFTYHHPIVDLRAFADRNFAVGCLCSFVLGIGLYGAVFLLPLFMARVRLYDSLQIGLVMIVTGAFQFLFSPVAGMLSRRLEPRVMLAIGISLFGLGVYLNSFLTAQSSFAELFLPQAVRGASLMMCFLPINILALGTLPRDRLQNASGLYNLTRNLGGAIGLALINSVLIDRMAAHRQHLSEWITATRPSVSQTLDFMAGYMATRGVADPERAALAQLDIIVMREATVLTFNDCFLVMAGLFALMLVLVPLIRRPGSAAPAGAH